MSRTRGDSCSPYKHKFTHIQEVLVMEQYILAMHLRCKGYYMHSGQLPLAGERRPQCKLGMQPYPSVGCTCIHLVRLYFCPAVVGQEPCRERGSTVPSKFRLKNKTASPFSCKPTHTHTHACFASGHCCILGVHVQLQVRSYWGQRTVFTDSLFLAQSLHSSPETFGKRSAMGSVLTQAVA